MAKAKTFSESWYRVAAQKLSLHPHIQAHRQYFRGEKWYVLRDPFNNKFYRLRPGAYDFIARLRSNRTVEDAWNETLKLNTDDAPGQEDVIRLLAQLYQSNMLRCDLPPDSQKLFERYRETKQRELKSRLLSIMFIRIPLIDPDRFLKAVIPVARPFIGPLGALIWVGMVALAIKTGMDNSLALRQQSQGVLSPSNLPLLYVALIFIKTLHEFGHALICRRYGGEVHTMGVMLLLFTPLPYMDASSSWAFRSRKRRFLVGAGGMVFEIFVAAIAMLVWAQTAPGAVHSIAYNMILVASVSTVLFNINPLLRFDGYYMLSDMIDIPNLHGQATKQLQYLMEKYAFGCRDVHPPTDSLREAFILAFFGVAAWIYRIVVFGGILLIVADSFLLAGILMFIVCIVSWVFVPIGKMVKYLASSPKVDRTRLRAILVSATAAGVVLFMLGGYPYPDRFRAAGIVESLGDQVVVSKSTGTFIKLHAKPGDRVEEGDPLVELENEQLDSMLRLASVQLREVHLRYRQALEAEPGDLSPLLDRRQSLEDQFQYLESLKKNLIVLAPGPGIWHAPEVEERFGTFVARGMDLGAIIDPTAFEFTAVVTQEDASRLFEEPIMDAKIRLPGVAGKELGAGDRTILHAEQQVLPSAALGWSGGGDIAVDPEDQSGQQALEPFFVVKAAMSPMDGVLFRHGRTGRIRFECKPRPLAVQWYRRFRQLLQKRYGL